MTASGDVPPIRERPVAHRPSTGSIIVPASLLVSGTLLVLLETPNVLFFFGAALMLLGVLALPGGRVGVSRGRATTAVSRVLPSITTPTWED